MVEVNKTYVIIKDLTDVNLLRMLHIEHDRNGNPIYGGAKPYYLYSKIIPKKEIITIDATWNYNHGGKTGKVIQFVTKSDNNYLYETVIQGDEIEELTGNANILYGDK